MLNKNMTMYEPDHDVVRWGLHLLDVCSLTNCGSVGTVTFYDEDTSQVESVNECYWHTTDTLLENDKAIACALQEELSKVAAFEASEYEYEGQQHQQASILDQSWLDSSRKDCDSDCRSIQEAHEMGALMSNFSELSINCEDQTVLPEIEDESAFDGEMGRRLNQMVPLPHVPKINGEIPSFDEVSSDHQRLLDRLQLYDLEELKISGDGNCQFRSLSDQIYRTPEHHKFVREQVVNQLKSHPELYENYVPMGYAAYLEKINKTGEWGDHVTLQAAADSYGVKIFVITSFKDTCYIEVLPHTQKSNRIIFLSFWAEVHYNSIYPLGELPEVESKKKRKRWWHP